jgi:hypothetical protein
MPTQIHSSVGVGFAMMFPHLIFETVPELHALCMRTGLACHKSMAELPHTLRAEMGNRANTLKCTHDALRIEHVSRMDRKGEPTHTSRLTIALAWTRLLEYKW